MSTLRPPNAPENSSCIDSTSNGARRLPGIESANRFTLLSGLNWFLDADPNKLSLAIRYLPHSSSVLGREMRNFSVSRMTPVDFDA